MTLKGAPQECGEFNCSECKSLESFKGAPRLTHIFNCSGCPNLNSFKELPEGFNVIREFNCRKCKKLYNKEFPHIRGMIYRSR